MATPPELSVCTKPLEDGPEAANSGNCASQRQASSDKKVHVVKILTLTLIPILGLWAFTVYSLSHSIQGKAAIEQTQYAVKFSVEIGRFLDRIQRERDMSVFYLSILAPETKTFLMNEYLMTDQALNQLSDWPVRNDVNSVFHSKEAFHDFLIEHRKYIDPNNYDIYVEIEFYSFLIEGFVEWMYDAIKESKLTSVWKILVSYQKIVTGMEQVGIERALGAMYFVSGGFPTKIDYETYNNKVHVFKSTYRSALLYSKIIDPIFQKAVTRTGTNLTSVIEKYRFQMQHTLTITSSIRRGQWWFDNMTLYLDTLLVIQGDLASIINGRLDIIIHDEESNLIISATFLVVVFMMCPLVIYSVESLTSDIQKYSVALINKTDELAAEKKKTDGLLYQMVPKTIADKLKDAKDVNAEYFKAVTIMFSDISGFTWISIKFSPLGIVKLLNDLYKAIDDHLDNYEVYKVETINDSYMVASGLPNRIGNRHSAAVAALAIDLLAMVRVRRFSTPGNTSIQLRIGINTGPCMAGIVGTLMPRYCLFGDTVNTASRMKSYGLPNKVHISASTHNSLKKHGMFEMKRRGNIQIKGKGSMKTYWLTGITEGTRSCTGDDSLHSVNTRAEGDDRPGEIQQQRSMVSSEETSCIQDQLVDQLECSATLESYSHDIKLNPMT